MIIQHWDFVVTICYMSWS